jgi:hypothetical protein
MKFSAVGAAVGAGIGAVARGAVVWLNLGDNPFSVFVLPSAGIGVLVGLIAGGLGRPGLGALVGGALSAVVFELFMLPCASLVGTFGSLSGHPGAGSTFLRETAIYALEMGVAGALAGGVGGLAGLLTDRAEGKTKANEEPPR